MDHPTPLEGTPTERFASRSTYIGRRVCACTINFTASLYRTPPAPLALRFPSLKQWKLLSLSVCAQETVRVQSPCAVNVRKHMRKRKRGQSLY